MLRRLDLDELITHRLPVVQAPAAYELIDREPEKVIQVIFTYPDSSHF
jgi:threonine dehydrogenase-like Zn-dependent dehydrogenase